MTEKIKSPLPLRERSKARDKRNTKMDNWWISGFAIFIYVVFGAGLILAWAEILLKAGKNRWLCFLIIIPIVNIIFFFWFAYSKWPIYEFVSRDWRRKLLEEKKRKLEQELSSLPKRDPRRSNISEKQSQKPINLPQKHKRLIKQSEEYFLLAAKCPNNSPEKAHYFSLGTEYKRKAEVLEKQLESLDKSQ